MSRIKLLSSAVLTGLLCLLLGVSAYAQGEDIVQIVTPVPPPKEQPVIPPGYAGCFTVPSTWYHGVWYPEHRVCQYDPQRSQAAQGDAFVEAHWACTKYSTSSDNRGECVNWSWNKGHWIKTFTPY